MDTATCSSTVNTHKEANSKKSTPPSTSSWTSRRRPSLPIAKAPDTVALHTAKVELIELAKKHAVEETKLKNEMFEVKMAQEMEILKQEKLKTEILSLQLEELKTKLYK